MHPQIMAPPETPRSIFQGPDSFGGATSRARIVGRRRWRRGVPQANRSPRRVASRLPRGGRGGQYEGGCSDEPTRLSRVLKPVGRAARGVAGVAEGDEDAGTLASRRGPASARGPRRAADRGTGIAGAGADTARTSGPAESTGRPLGRRADELDHWIGRGVTRWW